MISTYFDVLNTVTTQELPVASLKESGRIYSILKERGYSALNVGVVQALVTAGVLPRPRDFVFYRRAGA